MKSQVLSRFDIPWMPLSVLILFFTIFCIMIFYITRKTTTKKFATIEQLPLEEAKKVFIKGDL